MDITYTGLVSKKARKVKAFVYIMHEDRKIAVPDRYYTNICAEGYEDFNFNFKALDVAFLKSLEVCKHGN